MDLARHVRVEILGVADGVGHETGPQKVHLLDAVESRHVGPVGAREAAVALLRQNDRQRCFAQHTPCGVSPQLPAIEPQVGLRRHQPERISHHGTRRRHSDSGDVQGIGGCRGAAGTGVADRFGENMAAMLGDMAESLGHRGGVGKVGFGKIALLGHDFKYPLHSPEGVLRGSRRRGSTIRRPYTLNR